MFSIKNLYVYLCVVHNLNKGWIKNKNLGHGDSVGLLFKAYEEKQEYENRNLDDNLKSYEKPIWGRLLTEYALANKDENLYYLGRRSPEEIMDEVFYYLELDFVFDSVLLEVLYPDFRERIQRHVKTNVANQLLEPL